MIKETRKNPNLKPVTVFKNYRPSLKNLKKYREELGANKARLSRDENTATLINSLDNIAQNLQNFHGWIHEGDAILEQINTYGTVMSYMHQHGLISKEDNGEIRGYMKKIGVETINFGVSPMKRKVNDAWISLLDQAQEYGQINIAEKDYKDLQEQAKKASQLEKDLADTRSKSENKIGDLENKMKGLTINIGNITQSLTQTVEHVKQVEEYAGQVGKINENLVNENTEKEAQIAGYEDALQQAESDLDKRTQERDTGRTTVADQRTQLQQRAQENAALGQQVTNLQDNYRTAETERNQAMHRATQMADQLTDQTTRNGALAQENAALDRAWRTQYETANDQRARANRNGWIAAIATAGLIGALIYGCNKSKPDVITVRDTNVVSRADYDLIISSNSTLSDLNDKFARTNSGLLSSNQTLTASNQVLVTLNQNLHGKAGLYDSFAASRTNELTAAENSVMRKISKDAPLSVIEVVNNKVVNSWEIPISENTRHNIQTRNGYNLFIGDLDSNLQFINASNRVEKLSVDLGQNPIALYTNKHGTEPHVFMVGNKGRIDSVIKNKSREKMKIFGGKKK